MTTKKIINSKEFNKVYSKWFNTLKPLYDSKYQLNNPEYTAFVTVCLLKTIEELKIKLK